MSLPELTQRILNLPQKDRAALAHALLESLHPDDSNLPQSDLDEAQAAEALRRWREHQSTPNAVTYSAEEVEAEILHELNK